jgi:hypothetical protein
LVEWRVRVDERTASWRDNFGRQGTDELLSDGIVKRTFSDGQTVYGREQGYGRTLWSNQVLTVNRTNFSGKIGAILAAAGGAMLLGSLVAPPNSLSAAQEEEMRRKAQQQQQSSSSDSSGGDSGGDWDDSADFSDADGDFG